MGKLFGLWYVDCVEVEDWDWGGEEVVIDSGARGWVGGFILCVVCCVLYVVFFD